MHKKQRTLLPFVICGLAALFYIYDYFIQVAPSVMTHQLMSAFSINAGKLGLLGACFYYSYTIMQIPAGLLLDRFGARRLLSFAVFVSACGVTLFGFTHSFALAGFSRFLIGLGSSFAFICALFLISRWFAHKYFAVSAGIVQLAGCLGSIVGLAPLAAVINHVGWREAMITTGLVTFGLTIIYWLFIRDGHTKHKPTKQHSEWKNIKTILRMRQMWWIALCGLVSWVPVATIGALWGVPYLMKVFNWSNTQAGQLCTLFWIGLGIGSPLIGWLSDKTQSRCQPMLWCFSAAIIASIILFKASILAPWMVGTGLFMLGFSASVQALSFGIVKDIVPPTMFGTASGINNMAAIIGGAISQPLVGFMLDWHWSGQRMHGVPVYSLHNYHLALLIVPIAAIIGISTVWLKVKETHCQPSTNWAGDKALEGP